LTGCRGSGFRRPVTGHRCYSKSAGSRSPVAGSGRRLPGSVTSAG